MPNWLKVILGIIGTILLGAIGSGLWERFLSGFIDKLINGTVEFINLIFKSYKDDIFQMASLGLHESYSLTLIAIVIVLLPFFYMSLVLRHPARNRSKEISKATIFITNSKGYYLIVVLTISMFIMSIFLLSRVSYTNKVVTYSLRSIEIVKPYVSAKISSLLTSEFYQVRTEDDFNNFDSKLKDLAGKYNLKLPENRML